MYLLKIGPVAALVLSGVALFLLALAPLGWRIGLWQYGFGLYWMSETIPRDGVVFLWGGDRRVAEFPDGTYDLREGQEATVLQLPAQPKTPAEEAAQRRVTYVG